MWTLNTQDARGNPTLQTLGSGLKVAYGYNTYTGRLETLKSGTDNGAGGVTPSVQADAYGYDPVGNVLSVQQWANNAGALMNESFSFDALNRLRTTQVAGSAQQTITIDALGNITAKTGVGTYNYPAAGSARPHLIGSITGSVAGLSNPGYSYDANGNILNGLNRAYTWATANLPVTIDRLTDGTPASANLRYAFLYGPERQRNRQIIQAMSGSTPGAMQTILWAAGGMEKEIDYVANKTKLRTYWPQGLGYTEELIAGTAIAPSATATRNERYFHKDHLGSLNVITDGAGAVLQRMGFDSWGRRRDANGTDMPWSVLGSASTANTQDKTGYTGQEQLDDLGLVHLNGRVYDPMTGRMTSADPTIPNPYDLQSMNRASYVLNNPLGFTDPTGFTELERNTGIDADLKGRKEAAETKLSPEDQIKRGQGFRTIYQSAATSDPKSSTTTTEGKTISQSGQNRTEVSGTPQRTGTPGHDTASAAIGEALLKSDKYDKVLYNQALATSSGDPAAGQQKPDVQGVRKDGGGIDLYEVKSDSQNKRALDAKGVEMQQKLSAVGKGGGTSETVSVSDAHAGKFTIRAQGLLSIFSIIPRIVDLNEAQKANPNLTVIEGLHILNGTPIQKRCCDI